MLLLSRIGNYVAWSHHLPLLTLHSTRHSALFRLAYADTIVPRHSPRPIRVQPSRSHQPLKITSSPSSRNARVSPVGSVIGCVPRQASSSRHPRDSRVGPDTVPLAIRSPARRLQPLLA